MAACEKCWSEAGGDAEAFRALVSHRNRIGAACSPEEQAGPDAAQCTNCERKTVHQYAGVCMNCKSTQTPNGADR